MKAADHARNSSLSKWSTLEVRGTAPTARVGHTAVYGGGKVYLVAGATCGETLPDVWVLDCDTLVCDRLVCEGFDSRYKHSAWMSGDKQLFVFGGADTEGNKNDVQRIDVEQQTCSTLPSSSCVPSPRTFHSSSTIGDGSLIVFGGGLAGTQPVEDNSVYVFDGSTITWSKLEIKGTPPQCRQGHVLTSTDNQVLVHGGMSGVLFFDDLYELTVRKEETTWAGEWAKMEANPDHSPTARAGHGGVCVDGSLYIYGGMNYSGALGELWKFFLKVCVWEEIKVSGLPSSPRLDFAMVVCDLPREFCYQSSRKDVEETGNSQQEEGSAVEVRDRVANITISEDPSPRARSRVLLVHGGMDTDGSMFSDFIVWPLSD